MFPAFPLVPVCPFVLVIHPVLVILYHHAILSHPFLKRYNLGHGKPQHGASALVQIKNCRTVWISLRDKMIPVQAIEHDLKLKHFFLIDAMVSWVVKKFK